MHRRQVAGDVVDHPEAGVADEGFGGKAELERTRAATTLYHRQQELLAVALTSIGDAVIMTDTKGKVTVINKVAEELTGWSAADAVGKECAEVFKIINEDTREAVESPVEKVLRSGVIVGSLVLFHSSP